jgi:hypothetical protein
MLGGWLRIYGGSRGYQGLIGHLSFMLPAFAAASPKRGKGLVSEAAVRGTRGVMMGRVPYEMQPGINSSTSGPV